QGRRLEVEDHEFDGEVGLRGPELLTADQGSGPIGADAFDAESVVCGRFRQAAEFGFAVEVDAPDLTGLELTGNRLLELHENEAGIDVDGQVDEEAGGQGQVPEVESGRTAEFVVDLGELGHGLVERGHGQGLCARSQV